MVIKESRTDSTLQILVIAIQDSRDEPWILGWTEAKFERSHASERFTSSVYTASVILQHCVQEVLILLARNVSVDLKGHESSAFP